MNIWKNLEKYILMIIYELCEIYKKNKKQI